MINLRWSEKSLATGKRSHSLPSVIKMSNKIQTLAEVFGKEMLDNTPLIDAFIAEAGGAVMLPKRP